MDCIFCKIVAGKIPSLKIFENDHIFSFLDIGPLSDGHALVIPKKHHKFLHEMSEEESAEIGRALPKISKAIITATAAPGYNILQNNGNVAGQLVGHVHFHIIPREEEDGLGFRWNPKLYPENKAKLIQEMIMKELKL
jgi:histidine triad (HIT) family protein